VPGPTVFVIDDQKAVREALGEMLSVSGFSVRTYSSADSFLASVEEPQPGCIVADVRMPGTDGISFVRELQRRCIVTPVVLISGHADVPMAVAGIKVGAEDFIEKPVDDAALVAAINRGLARAYATPASDKSLAAQFARLTQRQAEIFDLVAQGFTNVAIAARLGISTRTVESYRAQVMDKMEAGSVAALVRQAIRLGRIAP